MKILPVIALAALSSWAADLDYKLYTVGGSVVAQGGTLHVTVGAQLTKGVQIEDPVHVKMVNLPAGVTTDCTGCAGGPGDWQIYGLGYGISGYDTWHFTPSSATPPGDYIITITGTDTLNGLLRTIPMKVTVLSAAQLVLAKKPFPPAEPIPQYDLWVANMKTWGKHWCDPTLISLWEGTVWFYDGERTYYQIADFTKDSSWNQCAQLVQNVYQPVLITQNGNWKWYEIFTKGMRMNFERKGPDYLNSQKAIGLVAKADPYNNSRGNTGGQGLQGMDIADISIGLMNIRESAFSLEAELDDQAVNPGDQFPHQIELMESLLGELDQMSMTGNWYYQQSFFLGLAYEALIQYYNERTPDPRIPFYIKKSMDALWDMAYYANGPEDFAYRCYGPQIIPGLTCYSPVNDQIDPIGQQLKIPDTDLAQPLNMLIAPAFAWMFLQTGDPVYRQRGDVLFAGGMKYFDTWAGKAFSQQYRWTFDYVKWRQQANSLATKIQDLQPPTVTVALPAAGTTLTTNQQLIANAFDNLNVFAVQFKVDGVNYGIPLISLPFDSTIGTYLLPNGAHNLTAQAWDDAGNTALSPPVAVTTSTPFNRAFSMCPADKILSGMFLGCYYDHGLTNWQEMLYDINTVDTPPPANLGNMKLARPDPIIDFNWGTSSPVPGVGNSFYAVVWQGRFQFQAASYTFSAVAPGDGFRIYIDNQLVDEGWWPPQPPPPSFQVQFQVADVHMVRVEYWHMYADHPASIAVSWKPNGTLPVINSFVAIPSGTATQGSYTLWWDTTGADSLSIDHGIGDVTGKTHVTVIPSGITTTYTLTAKNSIGSVTASAVVKVIPKSPSKAE